MDSKQLTIILSSLISQISLLTILLSHHFQFQFPISIPEFNSNSNSNSNSDSEFNLMFSLLHHFISSSESISHSLLTRPRKRARTHLPQTQTHLGPGPTRPKLGRVDLTRVDSVLMRNPDSFRLSFKMAPSTFEWLSGLLEPLLECRDPVDFPGHELSPEVRLGVGLFRLATGSSYSELATRFGVTDRVAEFCTRQLCRVLCTNFRFWVGFSNKPDSKFRELTGLTNCAGAIVTARFEVKTRTQTQHETVAAQIVVDSSCRIVNIIAGFHGSKNNNDILKSTTLFNDIENGTLLNGKRTSIGQISVPQYLIGDKGYTLRPWLITPYDDKHVLPGSNEEKFNKCHRVITRVSGRKTEASLRDWGILSKPIDGEIRDAIAYIGSCAILHNALLLRDDFSALNRDFVDGFDEVSSSMEVDSSDGCVVRSALATEAKDLSGFEEA